MARRIDFHRYRKLRRFLARTLLQAFWHDLVLNRRLLRPLRRDPLPRWAAVARRYRALAVEMGGVLIKLGQFLSTRVDLLPPEVTRELAGLQDEVPPAPFAAVAARLEADHGRPAGEVFAEIDGTAMGAASLAQVHAAVLPGGEAVVVKVLRPGIEVLVETDLAAVELAARWLRWWKRIRRRVDLDRLVEEIVATTRAELDLAAEGRNAEHFARNFADDPQVRVPKVHWPFSTPHSLCLENVAFIKVTDHAALDRDGVDRREVARVLYRLYMRQIFVHHFVHADPHPGNLFVRPLPASAAGDGDGAAPAANGESGRPFELIFVDFGMVATVPERLRAALREYAIALGTRDAARMVRAYQDAGVLLPGADLRRLEEVHEELFRRFWGVRIGDLRDTALSEARYFFRRYRDLLYEMPFQVQVELLFVSRAVGLLAGLATGLDPEFDPWAETLPFAERLAADEGRRGWSEWLAEVARQGRFAFSLPARVDGLLTRLERGELTVATELAPAARRTVAALERSVRRLSWMVVAGGLAIAGATLRSASPDDPFALWLLGFAAVAFVWGLLRGR